MTERRVGRPPREGGPSESRRCVRCTDAEGALWDASAASVGRTFAADVREALTELARRRGFVLEPVRVELTDEQAAWVAERCSSPREPSERLVEAMRRARRRQEGE